MFKYRTKLLVLILIPQRELVILEKNLGLSKYLEHIMICSRSLGLIYAVTVLATVCCVYCTPMTELTDVDTHIECYQCGVEAAVLPVCSELEDTPKYKVKCGNSTMCRTTISSMDLLNGSTWSAETRGCANQVHVIQTLPKGKRQFVDVAVIEEPYPDGCITKLNHEMRTSTIRECYCRGNLCNAGRAAGAASAAAAAAAGDLKTLLKIILAILLMGIISA